MPKRKTAQSAREKKPLKGQVRAPAAPEARTSFLRDRTGTLVFVLIALHVLFAFLSFEPQLHNGGDNAAYYALARSILSGNGYREIYDPGLPIHTQYPPVFPLMIAGLLLLGFQPWVPFKVLVLACSTAAIVLSYLWMRRKLRPELAFTVALLMALSPGVLGLSHWELSDVPFWAFTIAAVFAWERLAPGNTRRLIIACALTILAYFTRSAGLPLIVGAGAWLLLRRRWKQLAIFVASVLPFMLWWWWRARTKGGVDYVQQFWFVNPYDPAAGRVGFVDLIRRAGENLGDYLTTHFPVLLVGATGLIAKAVSFIVVPLALYGWIRRLKHAQVAEFFLPLYIGLLLVWPAVWSGERFLVPALPLLLFYAAEALQRVVRRVQPSAVRWGGYAAAALILLIALKPLQIGIQWGMECSRLYSAGDRYACHRPEWKDFFHSAELAGQVLPANAVTLSRKPRLFWAVSGWVQGRNYPLNSEPDSFFTAARQAGARYVVVDRLDALSQRYLMPVIVRRPQAFCVLYGMGPDRTAILGILPSADTLKNQEENPGNSDRQVGFTLCGPEYWRSKALMDQMLQTR